ncbi:MAG: lysozyme [Candidatus Limnocylindrus sp.]
MAVADAVSIAADLCRRFEGFSPTVYSCPANVLTIGYGSTRDPDGNAITADHPPISRELAEAWLREELSALSGSVIRACPAVADDPPRLAALIDFSYNLGVGRLRASTLRKRVNEQDWDGAAEQCLRWVRAGGVVLRGLVRRREAEAALLLGA